MKLNLLKALEKVNTFDVLPIGDYKGKVIDYSLQLSKSNKPMVKWSFEICNKRRFFHYTMLDNEVGLGVCAQTIDNLGFEGDMAKFDIDKFCSEKAYVGKELIIVLGTQDSQTHEGKENFVRYTKKIKVEE